MVRVDRQGVAGFLLRRRQALRPDDVGYATGGRRRTPGLRREEVAALAGISVDYYTRLEQARGPKPSEQVLVALTRGLRLTLDERDHLFALVGHSPPTRVHRSRHVAPALLRVLDRLHDTPAQVIDDLGAALAQNAGAVALLGDASRFTGSARSAYHRWFSAPSERRHHQPGDHAAQSRRYAAYLRGATTRAGHDREAEDLVADLLERSAEFAALWDEHEVAFPSSTHKVLVHPELGPITVDCQVLHTDNHAQALLVFTAEPSSRDAEALQLLSVLGQDVSAVTR